MYLSINYYDYKLMVVLKEWTRHRGQPWGVESARCLWWHWKRNHSSAEALSAILDCSTGPATAHASCPLSPASALFPQPPLLPSWSLSPFTSSYDPSHDFHTTASLVTNTN